MIVWAALRRALPLIAAVATLAVTLTVFDMQNANARDSTRSRAVRRAGSEAVALQRQLDRALNAPIALAAYIQLNEGRIDGFAEFTDRMQALVPSITNLQLAPDGVVTYIHPLEGNEAAIGHELLVDRERSTEAFVAVETGKLTMAGPFELVQGGVAMVGRQPIYLPGAGRVPGVDPDFWGFATVLINLDDFFEASRIEELVAEGYSFEISKYDRDEEQFIPFRSSGQLADPVHVDVSVANGTWQLALGRSDGWGTARWTWYQLAAGLVLGAAAWFGVNRRQRRDQRLVAAVNERTSDLRDAIEELSEARDAAERANNAKTVFLSNVSHELRTPLNAILGFAELIDVDQVSVEERESLGQIRRAGEHLLELINELLDITAIESGMLQIEAAPIDVDALVRRVGQLLAPLAEAGDVSMEFDLSGAVASGQESRLFQVVSNLTANAIRFTPTGGHVRLRTSMAGDRCRIAVTDNGIGISAHHLGRIFDPFERGDAPPTVDGSGMGLAIVQRLVEAMGGEVAVESTIGVGTTFTVMLPQPGVNAARPPMSVRAAAPATLNDLDLVGGS